MNGEKSMQAFMQDGMQAQQQAVPADTPLTVTLPLGQWNRVIDVLGNGPWHTVNGLIVELIRQMQEGASMAPAAPGMRTAERLGLNRGNGVDA